MRDLLLTFATIFFGVVSLAVAGLWALNYSRESSAPDATRRTSRTIYGFAFGAIATIVVAVAEFGALIGMVGDLVATFPGGFGQFALGALAVAGTANLVEFGVIGATVLVLVIILGTAAIRN